MSSYPTLSSGCTFMAPLVRTTERKVRVLQFEDRSEQRFVVAAELESCRLTHEGLSTTDADALQDFFEARKGDNGEFDMTVNGETLYHLHLDANSFEITQGEDRIWSVRVDIHQAAA